MFRQSNLWFPRSTVAATSISQCIGKPLSVLYRKSRVSAVLSLVRCCEVILVPSFEFCAWRYRGLLLFAIVAENRVRSGIISFASNAHLQKMVRTIPHFSVLADAKLCRLLCPQKTVRSFLCESTTLVSSRRQYL